MSHDTVGRLEIHLLRNFPDRRRVAELLDMRKDEIEDLSLLDSQRFL